MSESVRVGYRHNHNIVAVEGRLSFSGHPFKYRLSTQGITLDGMEPRGYQNVSSCSVLGKIRTMVCNKFSALDAFTVYVGG